ncbi:conjugative transfer protein TraC [Escherichia coli]|nr:conjugative transfer protein TraC [Escherichia coli]
MNNPLEAVTQAVNSLVTALKLPDESAKANEVLGEMSFPQFSRLLPYRDYNQESGLFMNDTTMGFMLEAIPINGANESIVEALDHMLRTKLPRGIPLCIHLMSSQLVGDRIEYGQREFSWSGEQAERFNAIMAADAMVEDVNYTMITDVQIAERTKATVTTDNVAALRQGTSGAKIQTSTETGNQHKYQTRVVSNANKVNLKFEEAKPVLEDQLAKSIANIL